MVRIALSSVTPDEKDLGTKELCLKRERITTFEIQLTGTLAGQLLKAGDLPFEHLEVFQKIYILRRRYLGLIRSNCEGRSHFNVILSPSHRKGNCDTFYHQRENELLEETWRSLRAEIVKRDRSLIDFLDQLFKLYPYDALEDLRLAWRAMHTPYRVERYAKLANAVWKR